MLGHSEIDCTCLAELEAHSLCFKLTSFRHFTQKRTALLKKWVQKNMSQDVSRNTQFTTSKKTTDQTQCLLAKAFCFTTLRARNIASIHLVKFPCAIPKVIHVIGSMPQQAIVSPKSPGRMGTAQQQYAAQHQRKRCPWKWARHENTTQPASKVHTRRAILKGFESIATDTFVSARSSFSLKVCLLKKTKEKTNKKSDFRKENKKNEKDKKQKKMH